jgi:hypothetical protein
MSTDPVIGRRSFSDGVERDVYLDEAGQYVLEGQVKVYGVWLADDSHLDEPAIVDAPATTEWKCAAAGTVSKKRRGRPSTQSRSTYRLPHSRCLPARLLTRRLRGVRWGGFPC